MPKIQTLPALLASRLSQALKQNGINIKHSTALRVTAAAYGYHNEHEMSAAAAQDRIELPAASSYMPEDLGTTIGMQVMTDPKTGRRFAFETDKFEKIRTVISPDGTLMRTETAGSPAAGALIITKADNATLSGAIDAMEKTPDYPRAIAIIDYADMLPAIENTRPDLPDEEKSELALKLVKAESERITEAMITIGTEICETIWDEHGKHQKKPAPAPSAKRFNPDEALCQTPDFTIPNHPGQIFSIEMNFRSEESIHGGDIDPKDPSDIECIRTTLLRKTNPDTYEEIENTSYATTLATTASESIITAYIAGLTATLEGSDGTIVPRLMREYSNTSPKLIPASEMRNVSAQSMADLVKVKEGSNACYLVSTFIRPQDGKACVEIIVKESDPGQGNGYYRIPHCEIASYLPANPDTAEIMALHLQAISQVEKSIKNRRPIYTALSLLSEKRRPEDIEAFTGTDGHLDNDLISMIADYTFETNKTLTTVDIENDSGWTTTEEPVPDTGTTCIRKVKTFFYHREDADDEEDTIAGKFTILIAKNGTILQTDVSF